MYCPVGKQRPWVKHPHTPRGRTRPVRTLKGPARLDWLGLSREATVAGTHGAMWTMERDSVGCQGRMETIVRSLAILKHWKRGVLSLERDGVFFFFFSKLWNGNSPTVDLLDIIAFLTLTTSNKLACFIHLFQFSSVAQYVWYFSSPWTAAGQASLSITNSCSLLRFISIESVMPSNHLILCHLFSSCLQSFPASGSFPVSQSFPSGGQRTGVSASAAVLSMNRMD